MFNRAIKRRLKQLEKRANEPKEPKHVYIGVVEKMTKTIRKRIAEIQAAGNVPVYNTIVYPKPSDVRTEPEVRDAPKNHQESATDRRRRDSVEPEVDVYDSTSFGGSLTRKH